MASTDTELDRYTMLEIAAAAVNQLSDDSAVRAMLRDYVEMSHDLAAAYAKIRELDERCVVRERQADTERRLRRATEDRIAAAPASQFDTDDITRRAYIMPRRLTGVGQ